MWAAKINKGEEHEEGRNIGPAGAAAPPAFYVVISDMNVKFNEYLVAPFPWFGGKRRVADIVWQYFGDDVKNYVEPFFGSGAVLLGAPWPADRIETVNDKDGFVCNFWRAIKHAPKEVAKWADWPVNENDLHARHVWLREHREQLSHRLEGDPDYYDAKIAGWWVWGISCWIGGNWCAEKRTGPWMIDRDEEGCRMLVKNQGEIGEEKIGVNRSKIHLSDSGCGVHRKLVNVYDWFSFLSDRLRRVRVCCGDWIRVLGPSATFRHGVTAVFLDPPYSMDIRDDVYSVDSPGISDAVRQWAIENGNNPLLRIALCGYEDEHQMPPDWTCYSWRAHGGYGLQGEGEGRENREKERIWFSPHCLKVNQLTLF